ncbi:hypothetical protein SY89_02135 [Halolamina pelagica]|uniref:Uncharacterized protein n=1 Tax=Halolamina pelagica TaxID=699431 RepID=A0A0P7GRI9_9EURY|nr:hypothetical protein [Halolamina pelagica]KPN31390.1 hypothetical protein SY89_02135 [Halolamina pelagica]
MTEVRELAPGLIELQTDKHIEELEKDGSVVAIYEKDSEGAKVIVDISENLTDNLSYIY